MQLLRKTIRAAVSPGPSLVITKHPCKMLPGERKKLGRTIPSSKPKTATYARCVTNLVVRPSTGTTKPARSLTNCSALGASCVRCCVSPTRSICRKTVIKNNYEERNNEPFTTNSGRYRKYFDVRSGRTGCARRQRNPSLSPRSPRGCWRNSPRSTAWPNAGEA